MTVSMDQSGLNGVTTRGSYYLEITINGGHTWNSISSPMSYPSYYLFSGDGNSLFLILFLLLHIVQVFHQDIVIGHD